MATVIDSLIVELGFDTKNIKRGQKETGEAMKSIAAGGQKTGQALDKFGKDGAQAFRTLSREALGFFAVLTAGKSLKAFIQDNTMTNVALQNQARNLGVSVKALSTWQLVAESFGGTAQDVSGSMQALTSQFQTVAGRQNLGRVFGQMHVSLIGANGQLRSMAQMIPDLAAAAQSMPPQLFNELAGQAGFSQGFINMLEHSPQQLEAMYQALQKYAPTAQDAAASQKLLADWVLLTAQSSSLGRTIMTDLTPEIDTVLTQISKWVDKNHDLIEQDVEGTIKSITDAVKSIDWKKVGDDINGVANGVENIVTYMGGWQKATMLLFDLWVGSKFISVLANARLLGGALAVVGAYKLGETIGNFVGNETAKLAIWGDGGGKLHLGFLQQNHKLLPGRYPNAPNVPPGMADSNGGGKADPAYEKQVRDYLVKSYGLTPGEADGLLTNMVAESGLNPNAIGDNGAAYGIGQWHADRQAEFKRLYGHAIQGSSLSEQLAFYMAEVQGHTKDASSGKVGALFKDPRFKALSEKDQARYTGYAESIYGERPAGGNDEAIKRANSAGSMADALATAQSSPGAGSTHITTITAPITIHAPNADARQVAKLVEDKMNNLQTYARQTNSGVQ